jgi:hypothetical protein
MSIKNGHLPSSLYASSAVSLPPTTYPLWSSLPPELLDSGKLSQLQLEGILYACTRHQSWLPSGERAGFFIGDGAGVGKGRQIAGIIIDNYARNRRKHVWVSISTDLHIDAQRDFKVEQNSLETSYPEMILSGSPLVLKMWIVVQHIQ